MKLVLQAVIAIFVFSACQKDLSVKDGAITGEVIGSDALSPLPCHSTSFVTNYAVKPGEVPPFRFTKTLYSDSRVKSINMLSRANPIHSAYKKQAYELIGTFSYSYRKAKFVGTEELWEYYKTSTGAGARKSVSKKKWEYEFEFEENGYCFVVYGVDGPNMWNYHELLYIMYNRENPAAIDFVKVTENPYVTPDKYYAGINDSYGNLLSFEGSEHWGGPESRFYSRPSFTYDYTIPATNKRYNYVPTQNLISRHYSLLEVMQWLPPSKHQRKTAAGIFYPYNNGYKVVQSQVYKNQKFDSKGNLLSYTYADNVLQKTTWFCK